ncbi:hypothetical protein BLHB2_06280 [Bacillus licheniformis]|nr:hypothetical protein BLHB2_06280 [Bacillus licheniformis]
MFQLLQLSVDACIDSSESRFNIARSFRRFFIGVYRDMGAVLEELLKFVFVALNLGVVLRIYIDGNVIEFLNFLQHLFYEGCKSFFVVSLLIPNFFSQ